MSNKSKRDAKIEACSRQNEAIPFVTSDGVEFCMAVPLVEKMVVVKVGEMVMVGAPIPKFS
jgi:hypothetical protein